MRARIVVPGIMVPAIGLNHHGPLHRLGCRQPFDLVATQGTRVDPEVAKKRAAGLIAAQVRHL